MIPPIVVIGSSNVDLIMKMSRLPQRGETVTDAVFLQTFGGKGANQAVAATAAGAVFCGSLAVSLVEGRPLAEGVRFASAAAALAVTRLGAQPSIPQRKEIDRFLRERGMLV